MDRPLTLKQEKFVNAFIGDANGNGTQAARMAGYSGNDGVLAVTAHDNLNHPKIHARIDEVFEKIGMSTEYLLMKLKEIIEIDNERFFSAGKESKVSLADKVAAIKLAGQSIGMYTDRVESSSTNTQRIEIVSIAVAQPRTIEGTATETASLAAGDLTD